jgi:hypothetical protein
MTCTCVRTVSGVEVDLLAPKPEDIRIEDIAHHLSKLDRYNGASPEFHYSVAQHCLHVADVLPPELKLCGLLHDATEAFCGDVVSPLKALIPAYKEIEVGIDSAVCEKFGLDCSDRKTIKLADKAVMAAEMIQLFGWLDMAQRTSTPASIKVRPMHWTEAKERFLAMFNHLNQ